MTSAKNTRDKIAELELDRRELADEYVALKTNYLNTKKAFERVVSLSLSRGTYSHVKLSFSQTLLLMCECLVASTLVAHAWCFSTARAEPGAGHGAGQPGQHQGSHHASV